MPYPDHETYRNYNKIIVHMPQAVDQSKLKKNDHVPKNTHYQENRETESIRANTNTSSLHQYTNASKMNKNFDNNNNFNNANEIVSENKSKEKDKQNQVLIKKNYKFIRDPHAEFKQELQSFNKQYYTNPLSPYLSSIYIINYSDIRRESLLKHFYQKIGEYIIDYVDSCYWIDIKHNLDEINIEHLLEIIDSTKDIVRKEIMHAKRMELVTNQDAFDSFIINLIAHLKDEDTQTLDLLLNYLWCNVYDWENAMYDKFDDGRMSKNYQIRFMWATLFKSPFFNNIWDFKSLYQRDKYFVYYVFHYYTLTSTFDTSGQGHIQYVSNLQDKLELLKHNNKVNIIYARNFIYYYIVDHMYSYFNKNVIKYLTLDEFEENKLNVDNIKIDRDAETKKEKDKEKEIKEEDIKDKEKELNNHSLVKNNKLKTNIKNPIELNSNVFYYYKPNNENISIEYQLIDKLLNNRINNTLDMEYWHKNKGYFYIFYMYWYLIEDKHQCMFSKTIYLDMFEAANDFLKNYDNQRESILELLLLKTPMVPKDDYFYDNVNFFRLIGVYNICFWTNINYGMHHQQYTPIINYITSKIPNDQTIQNIKYFNQMISLSTVIDKYYNYYISDVNESLIGRRGHLSAHIKFITISIIRRFTIGIEDYNKYPMPHCFFYFTNRYLVNQLLNENIGIDIYKNYFKLLTLVNKDNDKLLRFLKDIGNIRMGFAKLVTIIFEETEKLINSAFLSDESMLYDYYDKEVTQFYCDSMRKYFKRYYPNYYDDMNSIEPVTNKVIFTDMLRAIRNETMGRKFDLLRQKGYTFDLMIYYMNAILYSNWVWSSEQYYKFNNIEEFIEFYKSEGINTTVMLKR